MFLGSLSSDVISTLYAFTAGCDEKNQSVKLLIKKFNEIGLFNNLFLTKTISLIIIVAIELGTIILIYQYLKYKITTKNQKNLRYWGSSIFVFIFLFMINDPSLDTIISLMVIVAMELIVIITLIYSYLKHKVSLSLVWLSLFFILFFFLLIHLYGFLANLDFLIKHSWRC